MKHHCDVKRCAQKVTIVYLSICAEGHIDEFYLCDQHALTIFLHDKSCTYMHPVVDHMASQVNGDEPYDFRFYAGEWVAVHDEKVIKHGDAPEDLIEYAQRNQLAGTNIFLVKKELLPEVLWM